MAEMGRPTHYSEDMIDRLKDSMRNGKSVKQFCRDEGVSNRVFYDWTAKYPDFLRAFEIGKDECEAFWEDRCINNFDNKNFNTNLFKFYMANRHGWTDKKEVQQTIEHSVESETKRKIQDGLEIK